MLSWKKGFFIFRKNGWKHERVLVARFCRGCEISGRKKKAFFSVDKIFCEKSSCPFSFLECCLLDKWVFGFCRCAQLLCTDIYTEAMAVPHITPFCFVLCRSFLHFSFHLRVWNNHPEMKMLPLLKPPYVASPKRTISLYTCWLWNGLNKERPSIAQELGLTRRSNI